MVANADEAAGVRADDDDDFWPAEAPPLDSGLLLLLPPFAPVLGGAVVESLPINSYKRLVNLY